MLRVQIVDGPDSGRVGIFMKGPVRIGRAQDNDVVLSDPRVSAQHMEVTFECGGLMLTDRSSLQGLRVFEGEQLIEMRSTSQATQRRFGHSVRVEVGHTTLVLECEHESTSAVRHRTETGSTASLRSTSVPRVVRSPQTSDEAVQRRLVNDDPRLASIFSLARALNAVRDLERVLELVARVTFEAFPVANFFVISMPEESTRKTGELRLRPLHARSRGGEPMDRDEAAISQSLLRSVHEKMESMCFLNSADDRPPSESMMLANIHASMVSPLIGQTGCLGVIELDTRGAGGIFDSQDLEVFSVIASLTAFAMERVRLTDSIYDMFEGIVRLSVTAIDARDPSTAGHSERVADYSLRLAMAVNDCSAEPFTHTALTRDELVELRYAALLHDFGKVGVSEAVLTKPTRLPQEMLNGLRERLESARLSARSQAMQQAIRTAVPHGWSADRLLAHADELSGQLCRQLDEAERLLLEFQPGKPLTDEARHAFAQLARLTFVDSRGRTRPLLTSRELEYLLIPRGTLTRLEWEEMRSHALKSRTYLSTIPWSRELSRIPEFAGAHHEKLDGSGYPFGITAEAIPLQARILTVCDIFDAMTAIDRSYRKASPVSRVVQTLLDEAEAGMLDRDLVRLFIDKVVPHVTQDYSLTD
jgi:3',5'-cyclic-nucleotide phosphodiesterase